MNIEKYIFENTFPTIGSNKKYQDLLS